MYKEIHNLLKIENDKTTIFTNKELKMIDDYIKELEAYKYNLDRDYLRLEKENKEYKEVIDKSIVNSFSSSISSLFIYFTSFKIFKFCSAISISVSPE